MHVSDLMVDKRGNKGQCLASTVFPFYLRRAKSLTVLKNSIEIDGSIMVSRFQLAWPNFLLFCSDPLRRVKKTCSTRAINVGNKLQLCLFAKCLIFQSNASQYPKTLNQKPLGPLSPLPRALFI